MLFPISEKNCIFDNLSVKTGITIGQLTAHLFQLEMKGIVKPLAGGMYHLLL